MKKFAVFVSLPLVVLLTFSMVWASQKTGPKTNLSQTPVKREIAVRPAQLPVLKLPAQVMGVYSTSWIAGSSHIEKIIDFIKATKVNTLVIDVKDDTGYISFPSEDPMAKEIGSGTRRVSNLRELVARLKQANIYTIARIVVFKDPLLAKAHPEIAVKDINGGLWHDRKGMTWVDPNNRTVWNYNIDIAKEAAALGFSEVQFDYVRFLSDGKIKNCVYPYSTGAAKEDVIHDFLATAKQELNARGVPISADIFGLVLSIPDDNNIGQKLEKIATAVDYISPMVYPSHYPQGTFGYADPNAHPYEIVTHAMQDGIERLKKIGAQSKLRPWLQDFNLGHPYGREQLAAQIKALQENGVNNWLFWNPSNKYDISKYQL